MKKLKILLCVGGRVYGEYAAEFVTQLGRDMKIDCTVLYVNPEARTFRGQRFPTPKSRKEIEELVEQVVDILKDGVLEDVRTIIRDGEPVREILKEAEEGYHMVVTGTRGASGLERHLFESVASQVAEYAEVPVLVVRDEVVRHRKVLIATDGSEASKEAVYCGGYLAKGLGFGVKVLSVARDHTEKECAEEVVLEAKETLRKEFGIKAEVKVRGGSPPKKILNESMGNDLVVMGARGLSWIERILLGQVSKKVLANEETNVLIVRNCEVYRRRSK